MIKRRIWMMFILTVLTLVTVFTNDSITAAVANPNQSYSDLMDDRSLDTFVNRHSIHHYDENNINFYSRHTMTLDYSDYLYYENNEDDQINYNDNLQYSSVHVYMTGSDPYFFERGLKGTYLPMFKKPYVEEKFNDIMEYENDPVLRLDDFTFTHVSGDEYSVEVALSSLSDLEKAYIEKIIQQDLSAFALDDSKTLTYFVTFVGNYQVEITVDVSEFIDQDNNDFGTKRLEIAYMMRNNGGSSLDFLIRNYVDYEGYKNGTEDLGLELNVEQNVWAAWDRDRDNEYYFIDIPESGMYKFQLNIQCNEIKVLDMDFDVLYDSDAQPNNDPRVHYAILNTGEYLIEISAEYSCSDQPTLTVSKLDIEDDYPNTSEPGYEYFYEGDDTMAFNMDYEGDIDTIVFGEGHDFVFIIMPDDAYLTVTNGNVLVSSSWGHDDIYVLERKYNDEPFAISLSSHLVDTFGIEIETQPKFEGGLDFNNYIDFDIYEERARYFYIVDNFEDGSLYKVDIIERQDIYVSSNYVYYTLYDEHQNIIREHGESNSTTVDPGTYFIHFHTFNDHAQANGVIKAAVVDSDEVIVTEFVDNKFTFEGMITSEDDLDYFEITITETGIYAVESETFEYHKFIIMGIDNPVLYEFAAYDGPYFKLDPGTYQIVLPTDRNGQKYNFSLVKTDQTDEEHIYEPTSTVINEDIETRTYMLEINYFNDFETIIIDYEDNIQIEYYFSEYMSGRVDVYRENLLIKSERVIQADVSWAQTYYYVNGGEVHFTVQARQSYGWDIAEDRYIEVTIVIDHDITN